MDLRAIARDLARVNPGAMFPCPYCGASVKGANLVDHLARVHAAEASAVATRWVGKAAGTGHTPLVLVAIAISAIAFLLAMLPLIIYILVTTGVMSGVVVVLLLSHRPPVLELVGDDLILRRSFFARPRIAHSSTLEVGPLVAVHGKDDKRVGTYLRFEGPKPITIGCPSSAALRKHWTGWRQGAGRHRTDFALARREVLALQYALALRGTITIAT